jgi:hypothetical protein
MCSVGKMQNFGWLSLLAKRNYWAFKVKVKILPGDK